MWIVFKYFNTLHLVHHKVDEKEANQTGKNFAERFSKKGSRITAILCFKGQHKLQNIFFSCSKLFLKESSKTIQTYYN